MPNFKTAFLEFLRELDRPNVKLMFDAWSPALRGGGDEKNLDTCARYFLEFLSQLNL